MLQRLKLAHLDSQSRLCFQAAHKYRQDAVPPRQRLTPSECTTRKSGEENCFGACKIMFVETLAGQELPSKASPLLCQLFCVSA